MHQRDLRERSGERRDEQGGRERARAPQRQRQRHLCLSALPLCPAHPHPCLPSALCFVLASLLLSLFPPLSMPPSLSRAPLPLSDLPLQADLRQEQRRLPLGRSRRSAGQGAGAVSMHGAQGLREAPRGAPWPPCADVVTGSGGSHLFTAAAKPHRISSWLRSPAGRSAPPRPGHPVMLGWRERPAGAPSLLSRVWVAPLPSPQDRPGFFLA